MILARASARLFDSAMCAMMFAIQRRHRLHACSREVLERYIAQHEGRTRDEYFAAPLDAQHAALNASSLRWPSPIRTGFADNDHAHAVLFPGTRGWSAPTVIFLHALMSASDIGYRRWAGNFNERGWNAVFVHLPFHYSRRPRGHFNGELAITADLVRTAEGLRQGVCELRQLLALLRAWGGSEFGLWASSYGAWIGALLVSVERGFRWMALLEPIVDVGHAIWASPAGLALRGQLRRAGITPELVARHFPLASPSHAEPLDPTDRVIFIAGEHDSIALPEDVRVLHERWRGSEFHAVAQGHFGYQIMRTAWARVVERGWVE
jgi:pimeloyl-ACP methyl ester carboxylesterase